jgi:hypothetical protein
MSVKPHCYVLLAIGLAVTSLSFPDRAVADESLEHYTLEEVQACSGDAMRLCRDALPNLHKIETCMEANLEELSRPCQAMFRHGRKR